MLPKDCYALDQWDECLWQKLLNLLSLSKAAHMKHVNIHAAEANLRHYIDQGLVWRFGAYIVIIEVGSEWFTDEPFLIEKLVIKTEDNPEWSLNEVLTTGLEGLKNYYSCAAIVAGDTQTGYMNPHYTRAGFHTLGSQFYRE